jgi:hypothetical protein
VSLILDEVAEAVAKLAAGDVSVTADPAEAETNRPCVLVAPPTLDYATRTLTHRLIVLAGHDDPTLDAFAQLADLVDTVDAVLPVERAEPTTYPLTQSSGAVPAYLLTVTATIPT